jgi:O-antigen/teichoic acid export membrane protein
VLFISFAPGALRFGFNPVKARALLRFGLPLAGSSIVVFAVTNVDKLVVGAVLGPVPLGFYVLAVNLANWPVSMFSMPVRSVAPALLARLQGNAPVMRATFLSTAGLLAAITLPACAVLAAGARPLIGLVYGVTWLPAAGVLCWLGIFAGLRILFELIYDYFVVLANTRVVFAVQVVWLVALLPTLYAGARLFGPGGAGAAQAAVAALVVAPIYLYELHRTGVTPAALGSRLAMPVLVSLAVAAGTFAAARLVAPNLGALAIAGVLALGALGVLMRRMRAVLSSLRELRGDATAADLVPEPAPAPI